MTLDLALAEYQNIYLMTIAEIYGKEKSGKTITEPLWLAMNYTIENIEKIEEEELKEKAKNKALEIVTATEDYKTLQREKPEKANQLLKRLGDSIYRIIGILIKYSKTKEQKDILEYAYNIRKEITEKYEFNR
ncbi:MAG: hypothetical protein J7K23_03760 [Thermoproteales archaeon]|nr:hypothetical protein [Thermoproteales archaeon]